MQGNAWHYEDRKHMRTLDQQLMQYAHECVSKMTVIENERKKYGIWCHNLPGLIRASGLAGAVAFLESKQFNDLKIHALSMPGVERCRNAKEVASLSAADYVFAQRRILQGLVYFKRFATSLLDVKESDTQERDKDA